MSYRHNFLVFSFIPCMFSTCFTLLKVGSWTNDTNSVKNHFVCFCMAPNTLIFLSLLLLRKQPDMLKIVVFSA